MGRFQIVRMLGRGATGTVYLATDPGIRRPIALKVLWPEDSQLEFERDEIESQFLKEARLAGRLHHPHIVTVYDIGKEGNALFIAMEYVEGEPLGRLLKSPGEVPFDLAFSIVRQVAEALGHSHEKGVLHRDIKPANILVASDGRVKVTDFGVGELFSAASGDTLAPGRGGGSPPYMSPEQIRDEKLDPRSDLFSLAIVLYELLTGKRPFRGDSVTKVAYSILNHEPQDPRSLRADLPEAARSVFERLLAKDRNARPRDAREFLHEVERLGLAVPAAPRAEVPVPASSTPPPPPRPGRYRLAWMLPALLAAAVAVFLFWKPFGRRPDASHGSRSPTAAAPDPAVRVASGLPEDTPTATRPALHATARKPPLPRRDSVTATVRSGKRGSDAAPPPGSELASTDRLYRARGFARFGVSPSQARITFDGRFIGIADDWDGWAGGRTFPLPAGVHHVRVDLPGYRSLRLALIGSADAHDETADIQDRLELEKTIRYPRIARLDDRTTGPVVLAVDPPDALVSVDGKPRGPASSFGGRTPLELPGPAAHELEVSAPGRVPRRIRILVAPNAGKQTVRLNVKLARAR